MLTTRLSNQRGSESMSVNMFGLSAVQKRERRVQTNTPAFIRRESDPSAPPEFRESSLKGVLRYWYRAVEQEQDIKQLLKSEKLLFGGAGNKNEEAGRSLITLSIQNRCETKKETLVLPHRGGGFRSNALNPGSSFQLITNALKKHPLINEYEKAERYIDLMLLLGTFGMRSRRGAGSFQSIDSKPDNKQDLIKDIYGIMVDLGKKDIFKRGQGSSVILKADANKLDPKRPQLRTVWIGKPFKSGSEIFNKASDAGHKYNKKDEKKNARFLGSINPRVASPIIVKSIWIGEHYYPVISEVATDKQVKNDQYTKNRDAFLGHLGVNQP